MSAPSRSGSGVRDADGGRVRAAIGEVARTLATELAARTAELEAIFLDQIPEVRGDEAIQELMVASTSSNLSVMFDALRHGIRVDQIDVPAPAAAYAQRFAQRGLPLEALLRAYRLGDHRFIQWFMHGLAEHARTPAELEASASAVVAFTVEYVDHISEALIDIYRDERQLWAQRTEAARAAQIRAVLHDSTMDEPTAEIMTARAMNRWHVGLIAWVERGHRDVRRQMDVAGPQLRDADRDPPLIVPADDHTLWVWYGADTEADARVPDLSRVLERCPGLRVAIGEPGRSLAGFRTTHREAARAQAVAGTATDAGRVTRFAQVRLSALLSENLGDLRSWVHRTLGDLAADDDATGRLRETVRTLLECGGSYVDTAERLHIHRNTVRYRLQRAEEVRGRPLSSDRIDLEVALVACHQLGASVLQPMPPP
jgi:DNA-binding PucR family transcriptional regulator